MTLVKIGPLAVVMIAGPQMISAILLATSQRAKRDSTLFVVGAALATAIGTTVAYVVTDLLHTVATSQGVAKKGTIDWIFVVLLSILALRVYLKRKKTKPPKWMGELQTASPKFAFRLGFLLFIAMPTDVLTMATVGGYLAAHGHSLVEAIPFLLATTVLIAIPLLVLLALGKRADALLPKMRDWTHTNSWIISEVVIVFFILMELKSALTH